MPQYLVAVVVLFAAAFMPSPSFGKPAVNRHTSPDNSRDEQNCYLSSVNSDQAIAHQIKPPTLWRPEK